MTGRLSQDRRRLIHRYMDGSGGVELADELETELAEPDGLDEFELPFDEPVAPRGPFHRSRRRVGVGLRRRPQIAWVLAGAAVAITIGYLVAHG